MCLIVKFDPELFRTATKSSSLIDVTRSRGRERNQCPTRFKFRRSIWGAFTTTSVFCVLDDSWNRLTSDDSYRYIISLAFGYTPK
eukprot:m.259581 g.259581  ORF g.259581 m.259581 type:complete len:85 (-) comp19667_c0_seq7:519-773(-)